MKFTITLLYVLLLLSQSVICYLRPYHNWDMLGYMGCAISIEERNSDSIHSKTFIAAKKQLSPSEFEALTQSSEYRRKNFSDAAFFHEQLKLYWVKPLFVSLVFAFNKTGIPLTLSTLIPSLLSLMGMGILLFYWISKYLAQIEAAILSGLVMLSPPFWDAGRLSTPDGMAAFVVLLAFYFLIERKNSLATIIFLFISVLIRIDLALLTLMTIAYLHLSAIPSIQISRRLALVSSMLLAGLIISIALFSGNHGSSMTVYYNFGESNHATLINYFRKLTDFLPQLRYTHVTIFIAFTMMSMAITHSWKKWKSELHIQVALLFFFYIAIRFLIFPALDDRFFIAPYAVFAVLAVKSFCGWQKVIS